MVNGGRHVRSGEPAHHPSEVEITVTVARRAPRRLGERLASVAPLAGAGTIIVVAFLVCLLALVVPRAPHRTMPAAPREAGDARDRGADVARVASAFGYPARCLSVAISATDPGYASAHVDRTGACARYRGYLNASFQWSDGGWRLVLDEGQLFVPNDLLTRGPRPRVNGRRDRVS